MIQVELAIGPEEGISYLTDKGSTVSFYQEHKVKLIQVYCTLVHDQRKLISVVHMFYFNVLCVLLCPQPTHLANFNQVQSIQYSAMEEKDRKGMLQLNVAGAPEVSLPSLLLW